MGGGGTVCVSRAQSTVDFPIGGHVNVLSDYKETGPEKNLNFNTITAVMLVICLSNFVKKAYLRLS